MNRHLNFSLAVAVLLATSFCFAKPSRSFQIPHFWRFDGVTYTSENTMDRDFSAGTDFLLKSHLPLMKTQTEMTESTWHLESVGFNLGVSSEGNMGVLLLKGTPSLGLQWAKVNKIPLPPHKSETFKSNAEWVVQNDLEIHQQVESLLTLIAATGRVHHNPSLGAQLEAVAESFFGLLDTDLIQPVPNWKLAKVRLELSIGSDGEISFFEPVGASLRVRLDWNPRKKNTTSHHLSDQAEKVRQGIGQVLNSVLASLYLWAKTMDSSEFQLSYLRLGLGISGDFSVGITKNSARSFVHAVFVPDNSRKIDFSDYDFQTKIHNLPLTLVDNQAQWAQILPLKTHGQTAVFNSPLQPVMMTSEQFTSGLTKAFLIGKFIADRSQTALKNTEWVLSSIKTSMDFNLSGGFEIAAVSGGVSMEANFKNSHIKESP